MLRKIAPALTAGALILALFAFPAVPAGAAPAPAVSAGTETIDRANQQQIVDVFNGINAYRASLGVAPVTFNVTVSEMAEDWSDHMAATNSFYHNPNYAGDSRVAGRWSAAGEIIAANSGSSGQSLVKQWIDSPPHAELMRNPGFKVIGVGITRSQTAQYRLYGTVNLFTFRENQEPAGVYATAQDFFNGQRPTPEEPTAPVPPFADASQSAFESAINWMRTRGISKGYTDNTYRPFESVSREAMAAFIYRLAGEPAYEAPAVSPFHDVDTTHEFYKPIAWMKDTGLSTGWTDGTYRPHDTVSREAMAAFMKRYAGGFCHLPSAAGFAAPEAPTFVDSPSSGFYKDIEWMRVAEVSTGWPDRTYRPFDHVTREAMAAFMQRLDAHVAANGGCVP